MTNSLRYPHCDARVLHAPGKCVYCDQSGLQPLRVQWNIAFTDEPVQPGQTPCPAMVARGSSSINSWSGNRAQTQDDIEREREEVNQRLALMRFDDEDLDDSAPIDVGPSS